MIYLAQPYSNDPEYNYKKACQFLAYAAREWPVKVFYSPIVHWHEVAKRYSLPTDAGYWWTQNSYIMKNAASEMWVLQLPGWRMSKGLGMELTYAPECNLTITYIEMGQYE